MPKQKATFQPTVRPDWAGAMEYIPEQEQVKILQAILMFPAIDLPDSAFWTKTIRPDLQNQYETFIASCEKKAIGIRKRWETTKGIDNYTNVLDMNTNLIDMNTNLIDKNSDDKDMIYIVKDKDKDKDKENNIGGMGGKERKRFIKPTLEEIRAYCKERSNTVNPERFMDYYESNGWRVGKNPMKDWKAAIRTWEKSSAQQSNQQEQDGFYGI